jgi:GNAT superfamily N-acetyltransferase|tara:strand:- start:845 stop:1108 length:264 start_codon:yes stop_codon:yes gene_type:complete
MNELNNSNYAISFGDGVITFKNINTTLGYARYNQKGEIEYIFVNPTFRRKGLAKKLLQVIEEKTNIKAKPQEPISSYGKKLFKIKNK